MNHRYMLWTGHLFVLLLLGQGIEWLTGNIRGLPEFRLLLVLAAMTCLVINHLRWWTFGNKVDDRTILARVDMIVVANYCILVLFVLGLRVSFR